MARYYKKSPEVELPEPFAWDVAYQRRRVRLHRFLAANAPDPIIEQECRLVLETIARRRTFWTILRWIRHALQAWTYSKVFAMRWNFCRITLRWDQERCEKYFFGEYEEEDPELDELRRMAGVDKKEQ